jgi:mRNA-degrading endonuclease RelE of RelBE toxin-antitoxin system
MVHRSRKYQLLSFSFFRRAIKKLPRQTRAHLIADIQALAENPLKGKKLQGKFRSIRALRSSYKGTEYRTAYEVIEKEKTVALYYISTRENFYKEFSRFIKKRLLKK